MKVILLLLCCVGSISCWSWCGSFSSICSVLGITPAKSPPKTPKLDEVMKLYKEDCGTDVPLRVSLDSATVEETKPFVRSLQSCGVTTLIVEGSRINDDIVIPIINRLGYTKVSSLRIINVLSHTGSRFLGEALHKLRFTELYLTGTSIMDEGAEFVINSMKNTAISKFELSGVGLTDKGVEYLADRLNRTSITHLWLTKNEIGDLGAEAIVKASMHHSPMQLLNLTQNHKITSDKAMELIHRLGETPIRFDV